MIRLQILEGKASPLCPYELSQGDQRTTGSNVSTVESPFQDGPAFATQQKGLVPLDGQQGLHVHWTHWKTLSTTKQAKEGADGWNLHSQALHSTGKTHMHF